MLLIVAASCAAGLEAHETLFGRSARTMWKGGFELEVENEYEFSKRFYEGSSSAGNPADLRRYHLETALGVTHGLTRDFAVKVELPFGYVVQRDKTSRTSFFGLHKPEVGFAYRLDPLIFGKPLVHEGGGTQLRTFGRVELPIVPDREGETIRLADDNFVFLGGFAVAFSQARHYLWGEVSGDFSTQNGGTGPGPALHTHWAYAYRAIELSNYDELDLIFLAELDLAVRTKGEIAGVENPNSGYFKTHLALGVQVNITNLVEVKTGYNIPLYRRFNGRQLVHEGAFMLMFSYLL